MPNSQFHTHDFGRALRVARKTLGIEKENLSSVVSSQYVGVLERRVRSPSLEIVEKLASVMGIHPLTLLTLSYSLDESDGKSVEETLSQVHAQILTMRSEEDLSIASRREAVCKLEKMLDKHSKQKRIVIPQAEIDRAFVDDFDAAFWFRTAGFTLVPGRPKGRPGLAKVIREVPV